MGKYSELINGLFHRGKFQKGNYEILVKANSMAFIPLVSALLQHSDADIRETCAEILGDRGSPKAIPYLIEALLDDCIFVHQDAFWSIEKISGYQPGSLSDWLDTAYNNSRQIYTKVTKWWKMNKSYIQNRDI